MAHEWTGVKQDRKVWGRVVRAHQARSPGSSSSRLCVVAAGELTVSSVGVVGGLTEAGGAGLAWGGVPTVGAAPKGPVRGPLCNPCASCAPPWWPGGTWGGSSLGQVPPNLREGLLSLGTCCCEKRHPSCTQQSLAVF